MKIFIDNGHGRNTAWKRSPDGQFLEYYYNRIVAHRVTARLQALGFDAELLVPEEDYISLAERCRRVNAWCGVHGRENAISVSIHFNAYGDLPHRAGLSIRRLAILLRIGWLTASARLLRCFFLR